MTAHWLCTDTYKRKSVALACKRVIGSQTAEVIAKCVNDVINEYELNGKISKIITDNGANYIKAFKNIQSSSNIELDDSELDEFDEELFEPIGITEQLESNSEQSGITLPGHKRCSAHNMHLVVSKDIVSSELDTDYTEVLSSVISKCQAVFNKQNRSAQVADMIKSKIGRYLITPIATRWNSSFSSLKLFLKILKSKETEMNSILEILKLEKLTDAEKDFLEEYIKVLLD